MLFDELRKAARDGFVIGPPESAAIDCQFDLKRVARDLIRAGVTLR